MGDVVLGHITNSFGISVINNNMDIIQAAINNGLLNLSGGNNVMLQQLDMNSNKIINLFVDENDPDSLVTMEQINEVKAYADSLFQKNQVLISARDDLAKYRVVAVANAQAYYPDLSDPLDVARIIGITQEDVPSGRATFIVTAQTFQDNIFNWVPGIIYCSALNGVLTQTAPTSGPKIEVGRAVNTVTMHITPHPESSGGSGPGAGVSSWNGRTGDVVPLTEDYTFSQIGSTPTTIIGYGITDAFQSVVAGTNITIDATDPQNPIISSTGGGGGGSVTSVFGRVGVVIAQSGDYTFSQIGSTPTTLAGYGITDAATSAQGALASTAVQPGDNISVLVNNSGFVDSAGAAAAAPIQSIVAGTNITIDTTDPFNPVISASGGGAVSSVFGRTGVVVKQVGDYNFSDLGTHPTTIAGYGITDSPPPATRTTVGITSSSGATQTGTVTMGKTNRMLALSSNQPLRLRLYSTISYRDSDIARAVNVYPPQGIGILFEGVTTPTLLSFDCSPVTDIFNNETTITGDIAYTLEPTSAVSTTATITYMVIQA